jgi:hypothetical protein
MKRIIEFQTNLPKYFFTGLIMLTSINVWTQEPVTVTRLSEAISFDGVPDENVWKSINVLPLVMNMPVFGGKPSVNCILRIVYDDTYFYVSAIFNYDDLVPMTAFGKKRDYTMPTTDWLGIFLDSFNDRENTVMFWTNPNGVRTEGTTKNDMADPDNDYSFSWNTFWDAETQINGNGWSAEIRIPFSSLRFQTTNNRTIMGITLVVYIASASEFSTYPAIQPDRAYAYMKASQTGLIEFEGVKSVKVVYLTPYVIAGLGQANELNEEGSAYEMQTKVKYDAGLDAKYNLTNNLTLDVTINTDFAQVEADDQKINLTRFSLYFPEKRVFFLEKSDAFDFSFLGGNNLFYSRRIGLYNGNRVRIYGGVRMTGRINKWDMGVLDMQTAAFEENPGENFGVLRAKRNVFNENSYVGAMMTSRLGMNGSYNLAYGIDGQFRVTGDEYLTIRWAQTYENDYHDHFFDLSPSRFLFNWVRRKQTGFGYDLVYTWSGYHFNPGIGFELKDNYQGWRAITQYGWLPRETASLRYHKIMLTGYTFWNTATRLRETVNCVLTWYFEAKKGYSGDIAVNWFLEDLSDPLSLGNDQASVPPGRYSFPYLSSGFYTSYSHPLTAGFTAEAGWFYDGLKLSFSAAPTWNIGSGLDLGITYFLDYVSFHDRSVRFTNHIVGFKGLLTATTKTSVSAFIQYNTAIDKIVTNIRFRYNPREGNDFYLVYDEGLNSDLSGETPRLPLSSGRTLLLKYTYTFRI